MFDFTTAEIIGKLKLLTPRIGVKSVCAYYLIKFRIKEHATIRPSSDLMDLDIGD
jgi:hypothetical protein